MLVDPLPFDEDASRGDQYGARAVQSSVQSRKNTQVGHNYAAGTVLLRLAIRKPATKTTAANAASTPIEGHNGSRVARAVVGKSVSSRASIPYVSGLALMTARSQPFAPLTGNSAPESIHNGIRNKLMTA